MLRYSAHRTMCHRDDRRYPFVPADAIKAFGAGSRLTCLLAAWLVSTLLFASCRPAPRTPRPGSAPAPATAAIVVPYADLLARPVPGSERISQMLFGEEPAILGRAGSWCLVRAAGEVEGWVRSSSLGRRETRGKPGVVRIPWLTLSTKHGRLVLPMGALVRISRRCKSGSILQLGGAEVMAPPGTIRAAGAPGGPNPMLAAARDLLGVRYLWGGSTGRGIDCSGLTQVTARVAGRHLPRNARDQYRTGKSVEQSALLPGDLVFYTSTQRPGPTHVGIYAGGGRVIQASAARGVCLAQVRTPSPGLCWYGARRIW